MSVLAKIRNRAGLLVAIIGIALFAFVLGDVFTSQSGFTSQDDAVGKIAGKKISYNEFSMEVEKAIERHKMNSQESTIEEQVKNMLVNQTWDNMVRDLVMTKEYKDLGLSVSDDELYDLMMGRNPHPYIVQYFTDRNTGQIYKDYAMPNGMLNVVKVNEYAQQMNPEQEGSWVMLEKAIKEAQVNEKYNNLIKKGIYITASQAKREFIDENKTLAIKYVAKKYSYLPDSAVTVNETDLRKYYNEHQNEFKIKETTRKVEYVVFDAIPSAEDTASILNSVSLLAEEFKNNPVDEDSAFVIRESDSRHFDNVFQKTGNLSPAIDSLMFAADTGFVYGPYFENNQIKVSKLIAIKYAPDSVHARHILIPITNNDTTRAKAKADSLKAIINAGNFADLAKLHSADPGSGQKGGDLDWFAEGAMVPPFNDAVFNGKVGDMPVVTSQFGIHIIEILGQTEKVKKVKVGTIDRDITPSSKTLQTYFQTASEFAGKNNTKELFDKAVEEKGLNKRIADNIKETDKTIPGLESAGDFIKWAYKASPKDVSSTFEIGNKFIVAQMVEIKEKGIAPFEQVREQLQAGALREKKAELFIEQFNKVIAGEKSIDNIAIKMDEQVQEVDRLKFSMNTVPGLGREGSFIGAAVTLKPNTISKPVKGKNGVYVIMVKEVIEAPSTTDYTDTKNKISGTLSGSVEAEVFEALKENANIEDRRSVFNF